MGQHHRIGGSVSPEYAATMFQKERQVFYDKFPTVYFLFKALNKGYTRSRWQMQYTGYDISDVICPFAHFTQGLESWLVLDNVCRYVTKQHPDCPLITVHDSIMTTEKYVDIVAEAIQTMALEKLGVHLTVSISR